MKNNDYTKISHKKHSSITYYEDSKKIKYLKHLVTRILLSIILIISISIFIKLNSNNSLFIKKYLLEDNLKFTELNKWSQKYLGKIIPQVDNNSDLVLNNNDFKSLPYEKYHDGVKITMPKNNPITILNGGIVVFMGEKDDYGNTIIIQGNDGLDYWYGNITNSSINLYDYVDKDTLIGEASGDYIYLVLQKDGQYLSYDEYLK